MVQWGAYDPLATIVQAQQENAPNSEAVQSQWSINDVRKSGHSNERSTGINILMAYQY